MAKYVVTGPDGSNYEVTAPEGASEADVMAYVRSNAPKPSAAPVGPQAPDPSEGRLPFRPLGIDTGLTMPQGLSRFMAGAGKSFADLGRGVGQIGGSVSRADVDAAHKLDAPLMRSGAGMAGNITGSVATTLPTMAIPGVNTLAGAAALGGGLGALQPVGTDESRAGNAVLGAGFSTAGQAAAGAIGRAVRPVQTSLDPTVAGLAKAAQARGIPLDLADMTGSRPLQTIRSVLKDMPLTADKQAAAQAAKQTAFNRAVAGTFGAADDKVLPDTISTARKAIGGQFDTLAARNSLPADNNLLGEMGKVVSRVNREVPDAAVSRVISTKIDDLLSKADAGNKIPGTAYRSFDSDLGRLARNAGNPDLRHAAGELRGVVRDAMDNAISPADAAAWARARNQYANLMTVAPMAARSPVGDISGQGLLNAVNTGNRQAKFTGGGDLGELGRIGKLFVADQIPNSGTASRTFYQDMLNNPVGALWRGGVGGLTLPAQSALNSQNPLVQRYLTQGLLHLTPKEIEAMKALSRGGAMSVPGLLADRSKQ